MLDNEPSEDHLRAFRAATREHLGALDCHQRTERRVDRRWAWVETRWRRPIPRLRSRAPRGRTNQRRRGSRRISSRAGPGGDDPDGDPEPVGRALRVCWQARRASFTVPGGAM
jgi:hypothetical protein